MKHKIKRDKPRTTESTKQSRLSLNVIERGAATRDCAYETVNSASSAPSTPLSSQSTRKRNFRPRPSRSKNITKKMIEQVMHLKQKHAASQLSIGVSTLKKKFVKFFLNERWPCTDAEREQIASKNQKIALQKTSLQFLMNDQNVDEKCLDCRTLHELLEWARGISESDMESPTSTTSSGIRRRHSRASPDDSSVDSSTQQFASSQRRPLLTLSTEFSTNSSMGSVSRFHTYDVVSPLSVLSTGSDITSMSSPLCTAPPNSQINLNSVGTNGVQSSQPVFIFHTPGPPSVDEGMRRNALGTDGRFSKHQELYRQ
eukprot:CAMPEP_0117450344 /NCGR_PEP_ID=MMETSP0759-20121206/8417_1 /TAXON_ID=63605 /ORGANISM="Percolomonas cosmopolitus, Strain WS" /LENGTH=313 /DNA_ID=CAMNT_0005242857 /DNA_START=306 /DNA_END=1247 /DNA_ORIENTATION=-